MVAFKLVMSAKDGKSYQKEVKDDAALVFFEKKIGDKVSGDSFGVSGYEFEITGGSDNAGFPMRKDLEGRLRKKIFSSKSIGVRVKGKGVRIRKTVSGNTVYDNTAQINLKILKEGSAPLVSEKSESKEEAK
jgi:small subunit ribosomal protein S6e